MDNHIVGGTLNLDGIEGLQKSDKNEIYNFIEDQKNEEYVHLIQSVVQALNNHDYPSLASKLIDLMRTNDPTLNEFAKRIYAVSNFEGAFDQL